MASCRNLTPVNLIMRIQMLFSKAGASCERRGGWKNKNFANTPPQKRSPSNSAILVDF